MKPSDTPPKARASWLQRLTLAVVVLALGVFAFQYFTTDHLNEQIRLRVETRFREHYSGLLVGVESARRIEGHGIEIRGLSVSEIDRPHEPLLYIERILSSCDTSLAEFVTQPVEIKAILVERARVNAVRRQNGFWNVKHLFPLPVSKQGTPPLTVRNATITIRDETRAEVDPWQLREINLAFERDPAAAASLGLPEERAHEAIRLSGEISGEHLGILRINGVVDRQVERWSVAGSVDDLRFSPKLRDALPRDLAEHLEPLSAISGNTHLQFRVDNNVAEGKNWNFALSGRIDAGRIDDDRLPESLTEVSASLLADNSGLQLDEIRARLGAADLSASIRLDGYESSSPMVLRLAAKTLELDQTFSSLVPSDLRPLWDQLSLSGVLNGHLTLQFDGREWIPEFACDVTRLALEYAKFPYRVTEGTASLSLHGDLLLVKGQATAGNSPVHFSAEIRNPGPEWSGWSEAHTEEAIPIDERLLRALQPASRQVVELFRPRGAVQLVGRLDRRAGAGKQPHHELEISLRDCSVNYAKFPFPIDHIAGELRNADGVWSFRGLKGTQGTAQIECEGSFAPDGQGNNLLSLNFHGTNLALNETLRQALPVENQRLWDDIRPRGELETVGVQLRYVPASQELQLTIDGAKLAQQGERPRPLRVEPVWFPYALDITSGKMHYDDGTLQLQNIRALHDRTKLEADGTFQWDRAGAWSLKIPAMNADRLQLDHDLLAALPNDVGRALAKAKFIGSLAMTGTLDAHGLAGDTTSLNANWDLDFDVEDGRLSGDVAVDHIQGGVHLQGGVKNGEWSSRGDLRLDSAFHRDMQFTQVRGPFYVDQAQLLLGSWAERDTAIGAPRQLLATVFDGLLTTDAAIALEDNGEFKLQCTLENAELAKLAQEAGVRADDIHGRAYGILQMNGTTRGKHTWRGGGNVRLREAYLYKVPAMVSLLKLLSIRSPDSTAFTASDIDFRLQGDDVIFDRIDLSGDAISLKGRGRLYEQKQIDLMFYTQVGRTDAQLNILRPLIAEASPHFLLIEVTGSLDQPQMKKTAFPVINETLREMFPDLAGERVSATPQSGRARITNPLFKTPPLNR